LTTDVAGGQTTGGGAVVVVVGGGPVVVVVVLVGVVVADTGADTDTVFGFFFGDAVVGNATAVNTMGIDAEVVVPLGGVVAETVPAPDPVTCDPVCAPV
jgi:hypothetical protein